MPDYKEEVKINQVFLVTIGEKKFKSSISQKVIKSITIHNPKKLVFWNDGRVFFCDLWIGTLIQNNNHTPENFTYSGGGKFCK